MSKYQVPSQILGTQGITTAQLYREDNDENKAKLDSIGLPATIFDETEALGNDVLDAEHNQEIAKTDSLLEREEATQSIQDLIDWRKDGVLPRVKLAMRNDKRLRHFRPGKLQSIRAASVIRESRLITDAIRRFADLPEMKRRGVTTAMADKGTELIATAEREDSEAAAAHMNQMDASEALYGLEEKLDDLLAEIETSAAAVFEPESAALKRYRMNDIRNYVAMQHGKKKSGDTSTSVEVPDPEQVNNQ